MFNHLSRVLWSMGQALLPAHLRELEISLLSDSASRFTIQQQAPSYGYSSLRWNNNLLNEGILALETMTLVLKSGLLLELKVNSTIKPLNLNLSGKNILKVYLHIQKIEENNTDKSRQYIIKRDNVDCWMWNIELSIEQDHADAIESFSLAEFEKFPDGVWSFSKNYIPPLISLGKKVPFLKDELMTLVNKLEFYCHHINQEIAIIYLSGLDLINAKQCLKSVIKMQLFLTNLFCEISPHPYQVYEILKNFYIDLCFYHNEEPKHFLMPYSHENLSDVFNEILIPLEKQLKLNQGRSPYLAFIMLDGILKAIFPKEVREAKSVYLLVQKNDITTVFSFDNFKIASVSRLPIVHKFYLQGIPCKHLERPPFQHSFGPEVDIFELTAGEEWDHALSELSIGFYVNTQLMNAKYFLYWR